MQYIEEPDYEVEEAADSSPVPFKGRKVCTVWEEGHDTCTWLSIFHEHLNDVPAPLLTGDVILAQPWHARTLSWRA